MAVLENYGWAFGGYVSVLLGFYVVVIGGQFIGDSVFQHKIRQDLGSIGLIIAGTLVPSVTLIALGCAAKPEKAGALFLVAPSALLVGFLAIRLAALGVWEKNLRLAAAREDRIRAKQTLSRLKVRSDRNPVAVGTVNASVALIFGFAVEYLTMGMRFLSDPVLALLTLGASVMVAYLLVHVAIFFHRRNLHYVGSQRKLMPWFLIVATYVCTFTTIVRLLTRGVVPGFALLVSTATFLLVVTTIRGRKNGSFFTRWSLWGAAVRMAINDTRATLSRADREIRELTNVWVNH